MKTMLNTRIKHLKNELYILLQKNIQINLNIKQCKKNIIYLNNYILHEKYTNIYK